MIGFNISVVMSVYNGEKYLREAIESILNQTFADFEFIIIDDGSTDRSAEIIKSYSDPKIRLIQQENRGLAAALNIGLRASRGKYILRMDADDISLKDRMALQYGFLESHPECVALGSNALVIDIDGKELYTSSLFTDWEQIRSYLPRTPFFHSATMFRKGPALECGGYFEDIKQYFEDLIFFNQLARLGELRNLSTPLIKYRLVPSALTNTGTKFYPIVLGITERILANDGITDEDRALVEKLTRPRGQRWKESNYYLNIGKIYLEKHFNRREALKNFLISLKENPLNGITWFNTALTLFPGIVIRKWKALRAERHFNVICQNISSYRQTGHEVIEGLKGVFVQDCEFSTIQEMKNDFRRYLSDQGKDDSFLSIFKTALISPGLFALIVYRYGFWIENRFKKGHRRNLTWYVLEPFYQIGKYLNVVFGKISISRYTNIGMGAYLSNKGGIIIGCRKFGHFCTVHHNVTIGMDRHRRTPELGNAVCIGPNSVIYGGIRIGDHVIIRPGTVLNKNIPDRCVIEGNPAKIVRRNIDDAAYLHESRLMRNQCERESSMRLEEGYKTC